MNFHERELLRTAAMELSSFENLCTAWGIWACAGTVPHALHSIPSPGAAGSLPDGAGLHIDALVCLLRRRSGLELPWLAFAWYYVRPCQDPGPMRERLRALNVALRRCQLPCTEHERTIQRRRFENALRLSLLASLGETPAGSSCSSAAAVPCPPRRVFTRRR